MKKLSLLGVLAVAAGVVLVLGLFTNIMAIGTPPTTEQKITTIFRFITNPEFGLKEIKNEVKNIEDNTYVPFKALLPSTSTCDVADGSPISQGYFIEITSANSKDFIVTSVMIQSTGVDDVNDIIQIQQVNVDGRPFF